MIPLLIPPEVTSAVLTGAGIGGGWFASWLARRGKKEDVKIAERAQAFAEFRELVDRLEGELERKGVELARVTAERDAAVEARETVRAQGESRWDRQMVRCREITAGLVATISELRRLAGPAGRDAADATLRTLEEHDERDHETTVRTKP